jgi:hypothetical protein
MPIDLTVIDADRLAIIADMPTSVTIEDSTFTARKSRIKMEKKYELFGADSSYDFTLHFAASEVTLEPGDKLSVGGTTYRVLDVETGPAGVGLAAHCGREFA